MTSLSLDFTPLLRLQMQNICIPSKGVVFMVELFPTKEKDNTAVNKRGLSDDENVLIHSWF